VTWLQPPTANLPDTDRGAVTLAVLVRGAAVEEERLAESAVQLGRWVRGWDIASAVVLVGVGLMAAVLGGWWPFAVIGAVLAGLSALPLPRLSRAIGLDSALLKVEPSDCWRYS
jgi:hypothetical protein